MLAKGLNYAPTPREIPVRKIVAAVEDDLRKVGLSEADLARTNIEQQIIYSSFQSRCSITLKFLVCPTVRKHVFNLIIIFKNTVDLPLSAGRMTMSYPCYDLSLL